MKNDWKSPAIVVAIIGLLISMAGNVMQYHQNQILNSQSENQGLQMKRQIDDEIAARRLKESLIKNLRDQMLSIEQQLSSAEDNVKISEVMMSMADNQVSTNARALYRRSKDDISKLEEKKRDVTAQLNSLVANY